jgi:hypothetical protein
MQQYPNATSEQINLSAKGYSDGILHYKKIEADKQAMYQAGKKFVEQNPNATEEEREAHLKLTMHFLNQKNSPEKKRAFSL